MIITRIFYDIMFFVALRSYANIAICIAVFSWYIHVSVGQNHEPPRQRRQTHDNEPNYLRPFHLRSDRRYMSNDFIVNHNPMAFLRMYEDYEPVCSSPEYNVVLPRYDRYNIDMPKNRNWSLDAGKHNVFLL